MANPLKTWTKRWLRGGHGRRPERRARLGLLPLEVRQMPSTVPAVPVFNSNPGAAATLYLDFDGNSEATWGIYGDRTTAVAAGVGFVVGGPIGGLLGGLFADEVLPSPTTPVFSLDADRTSFSSRELAV